MRKKSNLIKNSKLTALFISIIITGTNLSLQKRQEDYFQYERKIRQSLETIDEHNHTIIAHRADSSFFPENSIEAIRSAVDKDFIDYIEIDINRTKDGEFVIHHDKDINGYVIKNNTFDDLSRVKENTPFSISSVSLKQSLFAKEEGSLILNRTKQFAGMHTSLSKLEDIVEYQKEKPFLIDLKVYCDPVTFAQDLALKTDLLCNPNNIYQSFNHEVLQELKSLRPDLNYSIIIRNNRDLENLRNYYDHITLRHNLATKEVIERELNDGKRLFVWTLNDFNDLNRVIENSNGNDQELGFITKIPDALTVRVRELTENNDEHKKRN